MLAVWWGISTEPCMMSVSMRQLFKPLQCVGGEMKAEVPAKKDANIGQKELRELKGVYRFQHIRKIYHEFIQINICIPANPNRTLNLFVCKIHCS